ncbi:hypothetical protein JCM10908_006858 [Rhodotorula pacifica]|uniref:mitochondrial 54S ribosomal protein uL30m MRPL33 n=1 Tax=Rhodotorula pacifica TaxID=1495444 RepID=UPI0031761D06
MFRPLAAMARPVASTSRIAFTASSPTSTAAPTVAAARRLASTQATQEPSTTAAEEEDSTPSHYLVTLLRSPLHLSAKTKATVSSLGLHKRLSSVIVPITPTNQGYLLKCKELVGVRAVSQSEVQQWAAQEWRTREGEGNKGSGIRIVEPAGPNSVIRVGSERARGDERGFRIVQSP